MLRMRMRDFSLLSDVGGAWATLCGGGLAGDQWRGLERGQQQHPNSNAIQTHRIHAFLASRPWRSIAWGQLAVV